MAITAINVETAGPRLLPGWRVNPGTIVALAAAVILLAPIVCVLFNLFLPDKGTWAHLASTVLGDYVRNTLWLALGVGIGTVAIGVGAAWLVTMCDFPGRRLFEWALILPLAVPAYVMAYAYTDFLQFSGPLQSMLRDLTGWEAHDYWFPEIRSVGGAIAMLTLVLYPYVYLLCRAAFLQQSICVLEVSRTLGCSRWQSFFRVALPLARPAIVAGAALALMETLADFGTVAYFAVPTFTTGIYRAWFSMGDPVAAAQLAAILLGFVFLLLVLERVTRGAAQYHHTSRRLQSIRPYRLCGAPAALAIGGCSLPLLLGFLLPAGILLEMALTEGDAQFGVRYFRLVGNTFTLAAIAAAVTVGLALVMAYNVRRQNRAAAMLNRLAGMGYAVPGAVIAVGILIPVAAFDNALDRWMVATFGISTGLLLTGGIAALVYAYVVRFLAVSLQAIDAGLAKITPNMDDAARALGATPAQALRRVHVPLLRGSLITAILMVFVDVVKELPATLVMRPFNYDTLAVQAYNLAADERLAEASTSALTIVAVGLIPVIVLSRVLARSRAGHRSAL